MTRTIILAILLTSAALAGCIGSDDDPIESAGAENVTTDATNTTLGLLPDGSPVPTTVELSDCQLEAGFFQIPLQLAGEMAPSGATPAATGPAGQTGTFIVSGLACTDDTGESTGEVWGFVVVERPEGVPQSEYGDPVAAVGSFIDSDRLIEIYEAWGLYAASPGEVTVETLQETPAARAGHVLATNGDFTVHAYTSAPNQPSAEDASGVQVLHFAEGEVQAVVELAWGEHEGVNGEATLKFEGEPGTDPFSLVFGNFAMPGMSHSSTATFPLSVSYIDV